MKFFQTLLRPHWLGLIAIAAAALSSLSAWADGVTDIDARRELFVEDTLIEAITGASKLRLHHPVPQELAIVHDAPWEGSGSGYHSIFNDGELYRMYYKSWQIDPLGEANRDAKRNPLFCAYAESADGIHWRKPNLGLHEFNGSKDNNIVMVSGLQDGLNVDAGHPAVFKDTNPDAPPDARYKAIFRSKEPRGLLAYKSPDGIHWSPMADAPIITDGAFDSQNLAFWDTERKAYRAYWRFFDKGTQENPYTGIRSIRTATSRDFIHWEHQADLAYVDSPPEQLYTNQIKPYFRAPHLLIGFPTRYIERGSGTVKAGEKDSLTNAERIDRWPASLQALPEAEHRKMRAMASERYGAALSEGLFMASRDGVNFKRWNEGFLRPGIERPGSWNYGQQYIGWQVVPTKSALKGAPDELSLYAVESYWTGNSSALRRYTLRMDGFVSLQAPLKGGELLTKPIKFTGGKLSLNFSTSAAGGVWVEIQDMEGNPLPGYTLADCEPLFGDTIDRTVHWKRGSDVRSLSGRPVRLRFVLKDADLYAYQFIP